MNVRKPVHVVAAALEDDTGRILVTQRPPGKRQAGRWEFPGGKLEAGEKVMSALARELREELDIELEQSEPLIKLHHDYEDFSVYLDVHRVTAWQGQPRAVEQQAMHWCLPDELHDVDILEADLPIIHALQLPSEICITPHLDGHSTWWQELDATLESMAGRHRRALLQLRQPGMSAAAYCALAKDVIARANAAGVGVMLNGELALLEQVPGAAGIHLPGRQVEVLSSRMRGMSLQSDGEKREATKGKWISAAVHDLDERDMALQLGADFLLASPVSPTPSHPGRAPIGWNGFETLADAAGVPCYALGGMAPEDLPLAREHGGQGVAGIRRFWKARAQEPESGRE